MTDGFPMKKVITMKSSDLLFMFFFLWLAFSLALNFTFAVEEIHQLCNFAFALSPICNNGHIFRQLSQEMNFKLIVTI